VSDFVAGVAVPEESAFAGVSEDDDDRLSLR
jgi:hypothetical protein